MEEAELNFLFVSNHKKMSIINNLSQNLVSLKITFAEPISILLHIGSRFKNLQHLSVVYLSKGNWNIVETDINFSRFNEMDLRGFGNLKTFKLCYNWVYTPDPLLLSTILTILKGCQKTLTSFTLEFYKFANIEKILDFICSKRFPLKVLSFKCVKLLSDTDIMRIVKVYKSNELFIQILCCLKVTTQGYNAAMKYINENNLNIKILFDRYY